MTDGALYSIDLRREEKRTEQNRRGGKRREERREKREEWGRKEEKNSGEEKGGGGRGGRGEGGGGRKHQILLCYAQELTLAVLLVQTLAKCHGRAHVLLVKQLRVRHDVAHLVQEDIVVPFNLRVPLLVHLAPGESDTTFWEHAGEKVALASQRCAGAALLIIRLLL